MILLDLQDGDSNHTNVVTTGCNNTPGAEVNCVEGQQTSISDATVNDIFNVTIFAYVGGLGFGIMSGLFATLNMLVDLNGPGTLGYYGQPDNFINLYAAQTLLVIMNHTAFTVIMSKSYQHRSYVKIAVIVALHMLYACLTLVNVTSSPGPQIIVAVNSVLCIVACAWSFIEAGGKWRQIWWAASLSVRGALRNVRNIGARKQDNDL